MRNIRWIALLSITMGMATARVVRAVQSEPVVRLTVHPAATSQPALQYKLLPDLIDQTPGNAATLYLLASKLGPSDPEQASGLMTQLDDCLDVPIDQVPRDKAEKVVASFPSRLRLADLAAHRQEVQWDYSLREEGVNALLPHLNDIRGVANLWSLQGRLQVLDKDWQAAARTAADGFSLARQLDHQAVLVQGLVGAGIASETLDRNVRDWVSRPGSPNLYWPLSSLPTPFVDVHEIARWEKPIIYFTFPALRDAARGIAVAPGQWRDMLVQFPAVMSQGGPRREGGTVEDQAGAAMRAALAYPHARAYLLAHGRTPRQVDAMPVDQAVGTYLFEDYRRISDDAWKAWELPFYEGQPELHRQSRELTSSNRGAGGNPLVAFAPAMERARFQFARIDREIALLRVVEAIRDYAARHDGQPPATLDEIKNLPVPIDPVRGQPFRYQRHGQRVTIDAPAYDEQPEHGERYEVTVAR